MTEKFVRNQLGILKQVVTESSLESARRYQNLVGELMALSSRSDVSFSRREFPNFDGEWITPQRESCGGVILYLHGGGYTCGELEYTRGFGLLLRIPFQQRLRTLLSPTGFCSRAALPQTG